MQRYFPSLSAPYFPDRTTDSYKLIIRKIRLNLFMVKRIIKIGLPAGLQSVMYALSNIIIQSSVNALGTDTIAAWTAYSKIDSVYWMIISALGISITTFVGQNYGAGKMTRVKRGVNVCLGITALITFLRTVLYFVRRLCISAVYNGFRSNRKRHGNPVFPRSDIYPLYLYRDFFGRAPRRWRLLDTDDHDGFGCLHPQGGLDYHCGSNPSQHYNGHIQLSADMGNHNRIIHYLLLLLQRIKKIQRTSFAAPQKKTEKARGSVTNGRHFFEIVVIYPDRNKLSRNCPLKAGALRY